MERFFHPFQKYQNNPWGVRGNTALRSAGIEEESEWSSHLEKQQLELQQSSTGAIILLRSDGMSCIIHSLLDFVLKFSSTILRLPSIEYFNIGILIY